MNFIYSKPLRTITLPSGDAFLFFADVLVNISPRRSRERELASSVLHVRVCGGPGVLAEGRMVSGLGPLALKPKEEHSCTAELPDSMSLLGCTWFHRDRRFGIRESARSARVSFLSSWANYFISDLQFPHP